MIRKQRHNTAVSVDANATAPVLPQAWDAYVQAANCADPRASHPAGLQARAALEQARASVARFLGAAHPAEIHFTSGGTEADALAWASIPRGRHAVTSSIEHAAVARTAAMGEGHGRLRVTVVSVPRAGAALVDDVVGALLPDTYMVSLVWACNETGVLQPLREVGEACRARGILVHTDAVQAFGRVAIDVGSLPVDLLSFSGHKVGAVGGIGGLYVRQGVQVVPLLADRGDNVPGAASLAAALALQPDSARRQAWAERRDRFESGLRAALSGIEVLGGDRARLPNTSCVRFDGCEGDGLMMALDIRGFAISTGSACSSGSIDPSPILLGMGLTAREARQTVRFSLPEGFSGEQVDLLVGQVVEVVGRMRS